MSSLTVTYTSAPPSPDYVPGLEHPPSPDYVPGLEYPEYLVPSDDEEEEESSEDDDDEEKVFEEDEDEEKEHLALADSVILPAIDPVFLAKEAKPFETDESTATPPPPPQTLSQTDIPEVEMPPQKRVSFNDTLDAGIRASESRVMTAVEEVNERVTDLATTQGQDAHELYEPNAIESCIRTLEAQLGQRANSHDRMEWQRQDTGDLVTKAFGHIYALKARDRAHPDDLKDTGSSC
ncbi:hypothetical protein Tco_1078569 [Tanacetum coccineum]|uniref:Uncharacterized protein n=1 Tax=Tanacetum coccineum TaxID=301880 RepID=A0ABQ5HPH7_9ASTR